MTGASIETTLELWASSLRDVKARMRKLFTQERVAASANLFLDGLLGDERRKTGWMRAEAAGDPGPWRQQAILGRGRWNADGLRDIVREYVVENLATDDAVLVIDETGFLKQGKTSCGVARQYTGSAGKITNCQIGVFAAYVSARGHAFIDRALYLPKSWTSDPARLAATHVPEATAFATKPGLAADMIRRALAADVPFSWVAADAVYGVGDVEGTLRRACKGYVLGVKSDHHFGSWSGKPPVAGTAQEVMVPGRDGHPDARFRRRPSLGDRRQLRDRQERARTRPQRNPVMAWLASSRLPRHDRLRHDGGDPVPRQCRDAPKKTADTDRQDLIRWSIQEVRRIATRLAQRRINPAYVIAWSCWRRAHQAAARRTHLNSKRQL
ncbi:IS701 family transposase [Rhizobium aegyptiacum]|uniref:IS701 family transposase n=1 Tax=Rhizobium aegyptiacum TaxID=1764550 RepID=UPI000A49B6B8